jgi:large subunit ribosomal protein L25
MKSIEIKGFLRKDLGKKASATLRKEGNVPCVIYGGKENIHFFASSPAFKNLVYTPNTYLVTLDIEGKIFHSIMKEIQFHPVSDAIIHIDFAEIAEDKPVMMNIPVRVTGNSIGVKKGGKLSLVKRALKVKALPKNLPDTLEVNVENLEVGQSVKVGDLSYANITLLNGSREPVVSILSSRLTAKTETEGEAAPAAGAAPAPAAAAAKA